MYSLDGYVHKIHIGDWAEISSGGWPELATREPQDEKGSSALSLARTNSGQTYLYVSSGGYPGDSGDYQGHVTAINLADGSQRVFNTLCSNTLSAGAPPHLDYRNNTPPGASSCGHNQSAVWGRPGVVHDPDTDKIFFSAGNGDCAPTSFSWGDSVLALKPDGSGEVANGQPDGSPIDSYTAPSGPASVDGTCANLQSRDADLGSTSPAILPVAAGLNSEYGHVAVQGGKDSKLRLLNLDNLSNQGGPGHFGGEFSMIGVPQGGEVVGAQAVWVQPGTGTTWVFVATSGGIAAFTLSTAGQPVRGDGKQIPILSKVWQHSAGGFSPLIANGVLYYAGSNYLHALDPVSGNELWKDTTIGNIHWESPLVANGVLYITDGSGNHHDAGETAGSLTAYSLTGQGNTAAPTDTSTSTGTRTGTSMPVSPTLTGTATNTPVPATATKTPLPATATSTATNTPARPTSTPSPTRTPRPTATATQTPVPPVPGVYETESLTAAHSPGITFRIINERRCSGGQCTILDATAAGQSVSFTVPVPASRIYDVQVGVKKFPTRGIFQLSVGGGNVGVPEDLYAPSEQYLMLDLGTATLLSGSTTFSFTVIGHNAASQGYKLGLDYIRLVPRS